MFVDLHPSCGNFAAWLGLCWQTFGPWWLQKVFIFETNTQNKEQLQKGAQRKTITHPDSASLLFLEFFCCFCNPPSTFPEFPFYLFPPFLHFFSPPSFSSLTVSVSDFLSPSPALTSPALQFPSLCVVGGGRVTSCCFILIISQAFSHLGQLVAFLRLQTRQAHAFTQPHIDNRTAGASVSLIGFYISAFLFIYLFETKQTFTDLNIVAYKSYLHMLSSSQLFFFFLIQLQSVVSVSSSRLFLFC